MRFRLAGVRVGGLSRALRQQPGVPNRDGFQRQSEGRTRRYQEQATSADDTHSFIHWALRRAHENLREPLDVPAAVPRVTVPVALLDPAGWRDRWA